jgi:hypothetical protein
MAAKGNQFSPTINRSFRQPSHKFSRGIGITLTNFPEVLASLWQIFQRYWHPSDKFYRGIGIPLAKHLAKAPFAKDCRYPVENMSMGIEYTFTNKFKRHNLKSNLWFHLFFIYIGQIWINLPWKVAELMEKCHQIGLLLGMPPGENLFISFEELQICLI